MNLLLDELPHEYEGLKIETNFRSFILFEILMQDRKINKKNKMALAINLFYKETPQDIEKAVNGILWMYSRGNNEKTSTKKSEDSKIKRIYSYEEDANYIYSAFLSQYGIDLNEIEYLHWWKFKSLFEGLNEENQICKIMGYRSIDLNKIKDKDERKKWRKIKQQWALKDDRTEEEKENDFANALW